MVLYSQAELDEYNNCLDKLRPTFYNWTYLVHCLIETEGVYGPIYKKRYTFRKMYAGMESWYNGNMLDDDAWTINTNDDVILQKRYKAYLNAFNKYYTMKRIKAFIARKKEEDECTFTEEELESMKAN